MAGKYTFIFDKGSTLDRLLTWTNSAGTPYNLTGWTAKMQVKDEIGGTVLQTLTTVDGTIVLGGSAGTIRLKLASTVTSAWTWESGVYDLQLTDTGQSPAAVTRLLEGNAIVSAGVTT